jgi:hypothetical protein
MFLSLLFVLYRYRTSVKGRSLVQESATECLVCDQEQQQPSTLTMMLAEEVRLQKMYIFAH